MSLSMGNLETARSRRVSSRGKHFSSKNSIDSLTSRRSSQRGRNDIPCKRWKKMEVRLNLQPPMRAQCRSVVLQGQLYLFGGMGAGPCNALWRLDLKDNCWHCMTKLPGRAPTPRTQHSICSDGLSRFFVFGGTGEIETGLDVLRTTNDQNNHPVRIRALGKRVVFNDLYRFDVESSTWAMLQVAGASPSPRRGHSATMLSSKTMVAKLVPIDSDEMSWAGTEQNLGVPKTGADSLKRSRTNKTLISGSEKATSVKRDGSMRKLEGSIRNLKAVDNFKNINKSSSIKEDAGANRAGSVQSFLSEHESEKTENQSSSSNPEQSQPMQEVMVPHTKHEIVVIGGAGPESVKGVEIIYAETWVYSLDDNHWTQPVISGCTPPARFDHTATMLGENIFIIGGLAYEYAAHDGDGEPERDVMVLNTETWVWSVLQTNLLGMRPPALFGHTSMEDPDTPGRILVFGGRSSDELTDELWSLNTTKCLWTKTVTTSENDSPLGFPERPGCRYGHIMVAWDPDWKEKLEAEAGSVAEESNKDEESVISSARRIQGRGKFGKSRGQKLLRNTSADKELATVEDKQNNTKLVVFGGYLLEPGRGYSSGDTFLLENEKVRMISRRNTHNRRNTLSKMQEEACKVLATASSLSAMNHEEDEDGDGIPDEYEDPIQLSIQTLDYVDHAVWDRFFNKPLLSERTTARAAMMKTRSVSSVGQFGLVQTPPLEDEESREIPSSYSEMKDFLLGIRPDKRTSKLNPRDRRQINTAPAELASKELIGVQSLPAINGSRREMYRNNNISHSNASSPQFKRPQTVGGHVDVMRF